MLEQLSEKDHAAHRRDGIMRCCVGEIRERRAQADRDAVRLMGSPNQLKPTWMDVDYLLSVIDRDPVVDVPEGKTLVAFHCVVDSGLGERETIEAAFMELWDRVKFDAPFDPSGLKISKL
jgi:hypothetical protein